MKLTQNFRNHLKSIFHKNIFPKILRKCQSIISLNKIHKSLTFKTIENWILLRFHSKIFLSKNVFKNISDYFIKRFNKIFFFKPNIFDLKENQFRCQPIPTHIKECWVPQHLSNLTLLYKSWDWRKMSQKWLIRVEWVSKAEVSHQVITCGVIKDFLWPAIRLSKDRIVSEIKFKTLKSV